MSNKCWLASLVVLAVAVLWALWVVPDWVVAKDVGLGSATPESRFLAKTNARQSILWVAGGCIAITTLWFTHRRDQVNRDVTVTGRYTEAITQIGNEQRAIRLGGIYALERIAADSVRDRQVVLNVLAAYLRDQSPIELAKAATKAKQQVEDELGISAHSLPAPPRKLTPEQRKEAEARYTQMVEGYVSEAAPPSDLGAAAEVLGRVTQIARSSTPLDLRRTWLKGAALNEANLSLADLSYADLRFATLTKANLGSAIIRDADLSQAILIGTDFSNSRREGAKFTGAYTTNTTRGLTWRTASE